MEVPAKAKTSTAEIEETLIAKRDALKESVENLARELEELKQTKADMPVSPVATMPVEPQPEPQDWKTLTEESGMIDKTGQSQGLDVELRPVIAKGDETLSIEQAIDRAISQTNGTIETGDSMVWSLSRNSLNKMVAKTNKDGDKPYQAERIKAIQNLKELALTAKEPMIRDDKSNDAEVEAIYEYMTKFSDGDKMLNLRLLCKKYKKPRKNLKDQMHSMAVMDKAPTPQTDNEISADGQLFDLEISFIQEKLEKGDVIGGADTTMGLSDLSPSVDNRDNSIANAPENATTPDDNRFADTGYIAGSRKEMASSFIRNAGKTKSQLGVTDIDWLAIEENPREANEIITKANVIGEPDYEALVANGMKPETAFLISKVYASIAPKPTIDSPRARKAYVRGIETLRKTLEGMKDPKEVSDYLMNVVYPEMTQPQFTAEEIEELTPLKIEYQKLLDSKEYDKAVTDIGAKIKTIHNNAMERTKQEGEMFLSWNALGDRFVGVVKHRYNTGSKAFQKTYYEAKRGKPDNLDWVEKKKPSQDASGDEQTQPKKPKFELFVSDSFERVGGRTVTVDSTKALKDQFGLRDIQSGNWVLKDKASAEFHVTRSAEAFADLADMLGIDDKKVSIGGRLAMAFGARGKSGARAHYEPVQRVINLTKMNGGGSLAHEWFHAFDNLLVEKMGLGVSGARDFLTEKPELAGSTPVAKAFSDLVDAMTVGKTIVKQVVSYDSRDIKIFEDNKKVRNSFLMKIMNAGDFQSAYDLIQDSEKQFRLGGVKEQFERLAAVAFGGTDNSSMTANKIMPYTEFLSNAKKLDGDKKKQYWSLNLEMAARAFSSYIEDKLGSIGCKNDYLSNHANNDVNAYGYIGAKPFPEGDERKRINEAFDRLFATIKQNNVLDSLIDLMDGDSNQDDLIDLSLDTELEEEPEFEAMGW